MASLDLLKPKVRELAIRLLQECKKAGFDVAIIQTLRTVEEQNRLYAQGRTKPGKIVTNARGGYSFHNFGVAFDVCPIVKGRAAWTDLVLFRKIGTIGMKLGLEWGGTWRSFPDLPHFQYLAGYALADFRANKVDWRKFALVEQAPLQLPRLKVVARGLNVRGGPSVMHAKVGVLGFGEAVVPLEKKDGWVKINHGGGFGWVNATYLA